VSLDSAGHSSKRPAVAPFKVLSTKPRFLYSGQSNPAPHCGNRESDETGPDGGMVFGPSGKGITALIHVGTAM
jgi:hypothetical protein